MNSMLRNNQNLQSFWKFYAEFKKSGKDPEQYFKELVSSGKYSEEQINKAINNAKACLPFINRR